MRPSSHQSADCPPLREVDGALLGQGVVLLQALSVPEPLAGVGQLELRLLLQAQLLLQPPLHLLHQVGRRHLQSSQELAPALGRNHVQRLAGRAQAKHQVEAAVVHQLGVAGQQAVVLQAELVEDEALLVDGDALLPRHDGLDLPDFQQRAHLQRQRLARQSPDEDAEDHADEVQLGLGLDLALPEHGLICQLPAFEEQQLLPGRDPLLGLDLLPHGPGCVQRLHLQRERLAGEQDHEDPERSSWWRTSIQRHQRLPLPLPIQLPQEGGRLLEVVSGGGRRPVSAASPGFSGLFRSFSEEAAREELDGFRCQGSHLVDLLEFGFSAGDLAEAQHGGNALATEAPVQLTRKWWSVSSVNAIGAAVRKAATNKV
mmetsp:Transcript_24221/g.43327  ORF Transcript_24221/g.43327 Transcript_24221/m.43327 type:complete len:372 (-) Transcript_24221:37-1152(-)|eukprot:CAMPEP_0115084010 /NCGR_PEP_ID=MMETSP0227-20121206/20968_1 /TAXON_ID=89957 /ORGANISM="Polarella glacialis, Strain CCMP 1383" /LENGTH=371 /DNA_ID=CAMNT_0002472661 /DNA_START=36 /DNA_END=1151 /DNA_ORIENTATION=-